MEKEVKIVPPKGYEIDTEHSTLECIKFKPVSLPTSWEEFCETHCLLPREAFIGGGSSIYEVVHVKRRSVADRDILPSKEYAEAILALCQLIQLRDCYNDGWEPDWKNSKEIKYSIYLKWGGIVIGTQDTVSRVLAFKTKELKDTFLINFLDLIKIAQPLL